MAMSMAVDLSLHLQRLGRSGAHHRIDAGRGTLGDRRTLFKSGGQSQGSAKPSSHGGASSSSSSLSSSSLLVATGPPE